MTNEPIYFGGTLKCTGCSKPISLLIDGNIWYHRSASHPTGAYHEACLPDYHGPSWMIDSYGDHTTRLIKNYPPRFG